MKSSLKNHSVRINEIEDLFEHALSLPKQERLAYVKQETTGRPEIEEEILSLLQSFEGAPEYLLDRPKIEQLIQDRAGESEATNAEFQPKAFGSYVLLRKLGVGGMAEIFHALVKGVGGFEKHVAIKSILPSLANDGSLRDLFEKEARINSILNHSNIAHVYDFLKAGDTYFLSMEFVAGKNLRQVTEKIDGTRISPPLACYIVGEVAKGLAYAHAMKSGPLGTPLGIVHRDISPKNIMCSYDGEIKIVDFGIAKAREHLMAETQSTTLKGTFRYMSPEQAFGETLDHRSDIFSAGLVLYELLKGKSLFRATEFIKALNEIRAYDGVEKHLEQEFPPAITAMLKRALARNPEDRYSNASDFHRDIARHLRELSFDAGYAHLSSFMQSVFNDEIQLERLETTAAIAAAKENSKKDIAKPGKTGNVFVPVKLDAVSMTVPRPSTPRGPVSARESWPTAPPPLQNVRTPISWTVLIGLLAVVASGVSILRSFTFVPAEAPPRVETVKEPETPLPVAPPIVDTAAPTIVEDQPSVDAAPPPTVRKQSKAAATRTVVAVPHIITLLAPRDGWEFFRGKTSTPADFAWRDSKPMKSGKSAYTIEISKDVDFNMATSFRVTEPTLTGKHILSLAPGHYHWRVRASSSEGSEVVSENSTFDVRAAPILSAPDSRVRVLPRK